MSKQSFDLVFMDIQMPKYNGIETIRILRKDGVTTPVIALTAHAMENEKKRFIQNGFSCILPKPFERENLIEILERHLS